MLLLYPNQDKVTIFLNLYGSVFPRVFPPAFCGVLIAVLILVIVRNEGWGYSELMPMVVHPFAGQIFATTLGFSIVFRTNIAWGRYWEAIGHAMMMHSKWLDVASQGMGFINYAIRVHSARATDAGETPARRRKATEELQIVMSSRAVLVHHLSLLSAMVTERLVRGDLQRMTMRQRLQRAKLKSARTLLTSREDLRVEGFPDMPQVQDIEMGVIRIWDSSQEAAPPMPLADLLAAQDSAAEDEVDLVEPFKREGFVGDEAADSPTSGGGQGSRANGKRTVMATNTFKRWSNQIAEEGREAKVRRRTFCATVDHTKHSYFAGTIAAAVSSVSVGRKAWSSWTADAQANQGNRDGRFQPGDEAQ